jgi:hypothetical protein
MGSDTPDLLTMAPVTRSATHRVTRSSTAKAAAKRKGVTESVGVAKMPPKRKRKKPVKVARKRKVARRDRVGTIDERREGHCPECGGRDVYGEACDNVACNSLCVISSEESVPSECYSSD